jgi:predicted methyltransferase
MRALFAAAAAVFLAACASGGAGAPAAEVTAASPHIAAALADPRRPEADTARDDLRHPADMLAFMQVRPGQRVADIGPGGGYFTRLLAVAVGEQGRAYAVDRAGTPDRPRPIGAVAGQYSNIVVLQDGTLNWSAPEPLDAIMIVQIYHDLANADLAAAHRSMFNALRPGGVLLVADHAAHDGAADDVTSTLHRIQQARARRELEAAGFVFEAESPVLRNPADDRSTRVFEGDIRGRTDQFVMRFRKPAV